MTPQWALAWLLFATGLSALARPGEELWRWTTDAGILSSPAIGPDGTVYCGSDDGNVYAVSAEGGLRWVFRAGEVVHASPAVGADGTIYVGSTTGQFYALS
jgi:outer membrane protein assembly factor BamB